MSLFDIFGTGDQQAAAAAQTSSINTGLNQLNQYYNQGQGALQTGYGTGAGALSSNYGLGLGAISPYYGAAGSALGGQYGNALAQLYGGQSLAGNALTANYGTALSQLAGGVGNATNALYSGVGTAAQGLSNTSATAAQALAGAYGSGLAPSIANYNTAQGGVSALGNALGLNGPAGTSSAIGAFENTPAYQASLQQGENAVLANQAATGQLASGNTDTALAKYASTLAGQNWNNYVNQLQPYLGYSQGAAGNILSGYGQLGQGLSGINQNLGTQLANLYYGAGSQAAGYQYGAGNTAAGLSTGLGQSLGNLYSGTGSQAAGLSAGLGTQLGNLYTGQAGLTNASYQGLGSGLAGLYSGLGNQSANLYQSQGNAAYGANASIGNAQANADLAGLSASSNFWSALLGGAGLAAGVYGKSDIRAKDDVEEVGRLHSGEPVVRFRYKPGEGNPGTQLGLIAQHVERVTPDAVREFHTDVRPMKYVDYKRATDLAAGLAKFLKQAA